MYEYTVGKRVDGLVKDLQGSVLTLIQRTLEDNDMSMPTKLANIGVFLHRASKAEQRIYAAARRLEKDIDNL